MIYVYLTLLILAIVGLTYTLYSLEINRKLNIKKRQIAIRPNRNKFYIIVCLNVLLILTFGGLFIYKLIYRSATPVVVVDNYENGGKSIKKINSITILENEIEYFNEDSGVKESNAYYYKDESMIYRYDIKTKEITSLEIGDGDFALVKDKIVVYYTKYEDGKYKTYLDLYKKDDFRITNTIIIDGKLKYSFEFSSFLIGGYVNAIVETFDVEELKNIGYQKIDYEYEENNDEIVQTKVVHDKVAITQTLIPEYHDYDRMLIHVQYNVSTDTINEKSICLADYYMAHIDGYVYLFCNYYNKDHYDDTSFILKYNPNNQTIRDYHTYNYIIYSAPYFYKDGLSTYLSFVTYNLSYQNYQRLLIDDDLVIIETKDIAINKTEYNHDKQKNVMLFDNKIKTIKNILYYDNNKLINYEINKDEKKIIINEFVLDTKEINHYNLLFDDTFNNAIIKDIVLYQDNYYVIYNVDDMNGYVCFEKITNKENEEKIDSVEMSATLSNDKYYFVSNQLLTNHTENDEVEIIIKNLSELKNNEEEGE